MNKKQWEIPKLVIEEFLANEYVGTCDTYSISCGSGGGTESDPLTVFQFVKYETIDDFISAPNIIADPKKIYILSTEHTSCTCEDKIHYTPMEKWSYGYAISSSIYKQILDGSNPSISAGDIQKITAYAVDGDCGDPTCPCTIAVDYGTTHRQYDKARS